MRLEIKTTKLQEMLNRAIRGASNNKMIPLTSLLAIELKAGQLKLVTTDATNYLNVNEYDVDGDDFYVVVQADMFAKLISRTTADMITLEVKDDTLFVKGNGKYSIELPLDEEGQLIRFPNPIESVQVNASNSNVISLDTIKTILNTAKSALATTLENPCYTGYYIGKNVIATDTYKICGIDIELLPEPVLISPEMMDLLDVMTDESIEVGILDDKRLIFNSPNCIVYGSQLEGIEDYAVDAISNLIESEFESMCVIPKATLLNVLERLSLFVGAYDKNGIYLTFSNDSMKITSKASSGVESIDYIECKHPVEFTACIDIEMLKSQIKSLTGERVSMWYGRDNAIKLVEDKITQIIALLEDDTLE